MHDGRSMYSAARAFQVGLKVFPENVTARCLADTWLQELPETLDFEPRLWEGKASAQALSKPQLQAVKIDTFSQQQDELDSCASFEGESLPCCDALPI